MSNGDEAEVLRNVRCVASEAPVRMPGLWDAASSGATEEMNAILGTVIAHLEIADIAIAFVGLKREAERLRQQRVTSLCERAEPTGTVCAQPTQEQPCWKGRDNSGEDSVLIVQPDDWCAGCADRQAVHVKYRNAVKQRGIAMRRLMQRIDRHGKKLDDASKVEPKAEPAPITTMPVEQHRTDRDVDLLVDRIADAFTDIEDIPW